MPGFVGLPELIVLLVVLLLIFGPKRLPEMGRSLGKGMREFKDSVTGSGKDEHEDHKALATQTSVTTPVEPTASVAAARREHDTV